MKVQPIILTGKVVQLEPLTENHVPNLTISGQDESIWQYMLYNTIRTEQQMRAWVLDLLDRQTKGTDLPFAVIHLESEKVIGSTRYLNIQPYDRALEIGGTWYAVEFQRTAVNTECKYLLLKHAFEELKCIRVQFKTDLRTLATSPGTNRSSQGRYFTQPYDHTGWIYP